MTRSRSTPAAGPIACVLGAIGLPLAAALPWVLSGSAQKSAFSLAKSARELGLAQAADDLGFASESLVNVLLWMLFASPLLAGILVLLFVFGWHRIAAAVSLVVALIGVVGGGAGTVAGDRESGLLLGPPFALLAGLVALVGTILVIRRRKPNRNVSLDPNVSD
jgi:hypothetical protein